MLSTPGIVNKNENAPLPKGDDKNNVKIKTTPDQDQKIRDYIDQQKKDPSRYWAPTNNCADYTREALQNAGIDLPDRIIDTPEQLLEDIRNYNEKNDCPE